MDSETLSPESAGEVSLSPEQQLRLEQRVDLALVDRSKLAALTMLVALTGIGFMTPLHADHPRLTLAAIVGMAIATVARIGLTVRFAYFVAIDRARWRRDLTLSILAMGGIWAAVTSFVIARYGFGQATMLLLICNAGVMAGALTSLAPRVRVLVHLLVVLGVPAIATMLLVGGPEMASSAFVMGLYLIFLLVAARRVHGDFERGERQVFALEDRAIELEATQSRAVEASRAKSEFLANMSHEIRTPMNGVLGTTELLLASKLDDSQRDLAETTHQSALALLDIINDVLDFSKIEAKKMVLERIAFDPRPVLEDVCGLLASRAEAKGLELVCDAAPDLPTAIEGDPGRIRQVLLNLVGNAIKFTEQGEVHVTARRVGLDQATTTLRFAVRDTGIGIPLERQASVFESFTQADGSMTRRFGGTGLGLTISRQLVGLMGGGMSLQSEPGVGTTFAFEAAFPLAIGDERPGLGERLTGRHVLLVQQPGTSRDVTERWLRAWGLDLEVIPEPDAALTRLRTGGFAIELVLLDHRLPGDGAKEMALRLHERGPRMPLVWLAAPNRPEERAELLALGARAFAARPLRAAMLQRAVEEGFGITSEPKGIPVVAGGEIELPGHLRILLVEDNAVNRKVALRLLQQKGLAADVAVNGREAVEAWEQAEYDIVLMDVQMPEMDGYEATQEIRERERRRQRRTVIVAMTANAMVGDRERCLAAGMDDYITKPVRAERLFEALAEWAGRSGEAEAA